MSNQELLTLLGLADGEVSAERVEGAFEDRRNQYRIDLEEAGSKAERLIAKRTLRDFEQLGPAVSLFAVDFRTRMLFKRIRDNLTEGHIRLGEVAWKEARRILEQAGLEEERRFQLDDAWAELQQAAEQSGINISREVEVKAASPKSEIPTVEAFPGLDGDDQANSSLAEPQVDGAADERDAEISLGGAQGGQEGQGQDPSLNGQLNTTPLLAPCQRADCLTLSGPDGELLHVLAKEISTFGRSRDCEVVTRAYSPGDEATRVRVSRLISRLHFTVKRESDDVLILNGGWVEGRHQLAANGIFADDEEFDRLKLFRSGTESIRLLREHHADNPPAWRVDLRMTPPTAMEPVVATEVPSGPQALALKRMDGLCEDVLFLWGAVDMRSLEWSEESLWLLRYDGGFVFSAGANWVPLEMGFTIGGGWRVVSMGSLSFRE